MQAHENSKTLISFSRFSRITHESKPTDIIQKSCALSKSPQTIAEIVIVSRSIYIYRQKFALLLNLDVNTVFHHHNKQKSNNE